MPKANSQDVTIVDGSLDFSGGVNSYLVPTIASDRNPNGLKRNQLSWLNNATLRGGGITQRPGWLRLGSLPDSAMGLYQGSFMYEPDTEQPYLIMAIGGQIWKVDPDDATQAVDLSAQFGLSLPADQERYYFCQAEQFLVTQAGDLFKLPLIWDGSILRKSLGLSGLGLEAEPPGTVQGHYVFTDSYVLPAFWTVPAVGGNVVINTTGTATLGTHVFILNGYSYNPTNGNLLSYSAILSSWLVFAVNPGVSVTLQLLGYGPGSAPGTNFAGVNFFSLTQEPAVFTPGTAEIPPATAMDYYMGRLWYAQGRQYSAGDIVGNQASGTQPYNFRDSVLKVTENPLAVGGDGFTVPTNAGNIRAIKHSANINTALGEGQLYIFTRRSVYSLTVPVTRNDWIGANSQNQPLQQVVQITNGAVNDRTVAEQNGDLFFQSFEPSIRSLVLAIRYYEQWGNTPISINENRILRFNDRGRMQFSSGVSFDNRMLQLVLPEECPVGTVHRAVIPLNFDVISTLEQKLPPVWEGMYEGIGFLELTTGDFGGRQRCIAPVWSDKDRNLQLWEISTSERFEADDKRVAWYIEFPAFTWGDEFELKKLVSAELWLDRIYGEVMYALEYRPDGDPCWYMWHQWKFCTARNSCEDVHNPVCLYQKEYCESFRETVTLPRPPDSCQRASGRPTTIGYQFQCRLTIKGFCRVRGLLLKAEKMKQQLYGPDQVC